MTPKDPNKPPTEAQTRAARLKVALKANMGRRKQQTRARRAPADAGNNETKGQ